MNDKLIYTEPIQLSEGLTLHIDSKHPQNLLIMRNKALLDVFSLSRRIYTLFRLLYQYTNTENYMYDHKEQRVYAAPIAISPNLYMRMNAICNYLVVEFIQPLSNEDEEILFLVKATAPTTALFEGITIAQSFLHDRTIRLKYPMWFKEMVEVLSLLNL